MDKEMRGEKGITSYTVQKGKKKNGVLRKKGDFWLFQREVIVRAPSGYKIVQKTSFVGALSILILRKGSNITSTLKVKRICSDFYLYKKIILS